MGRFFKTQLDPAGGRIQSLDQFRGWAVVTMILVNYLGDYDRMPWTFKHHRTGFSFADTVAPMFLFAVGLAYRHTFLRAVSRGGLAAARRSAVRRYLLLILLGTVVYGQGELWSGDGLAQSLKNILRCDMWDALVDIGFAGLLALPFIHRGRAWLAASALAYLVLYQSLYSLAGYGTWVMSNSIDGGPLGPLSWVVGLLAGALVYDEFSRRSRSSFLKMGLVSGALLFAVGHGLSGIWPHSQRGMTSSYAIASTGISLLFFSGFCFLADMRGALVPTLSTFGKNALFLYLLHEIVTLAVGAAIPSDSAVQWPILGFGVVFCLCYAAGRALERRNLYFRL